MDQRCIIYGLVDPRTGEIRYIGQSSKGLKRAYSHRFPSVQKGSKNRHKNRWITELVALGTIYDVVILEEVVSRDMLDDAEVRWITYGKTASWPLTNILAGGENRPTWSGKRHTAKTLAKMSAAKIGIVFSATTREKMSASAKVKEFSSEHRKNLGAARRSRPNSPITRSKISVALAGKPKPYLSARNKLMVWTPEMRGKISAARALNTTNPPKAKKIEFNGETCSIAEWSRRSGVPYCRLRARIMDLGWTLEKALSASRQSNQFGAK